MSDDTPGAGQGALPPREGQSLRPVVAAERPTTMRLTQVAGGQYVLTTQPHGVGVPALAQLTPASLSNVQGGVTRIISISPSRGQQTPPLRPSLANQSIVNVLKRSSPNVRLQLFQSSEAATSSTSTSTLSAPSTPTHSRAVKRPSSSTPEKKDSYAAKLQKVLNHRIVRSKLVKEKYAEHLLELFYLQSGGNILDLYQYAKRPKTQAYLNYMREHAIDKEYADQPPPIAIPHTTPSTPTATSASSLPGISVNTPSQPLKQQQPATPHVVSKPPTPTPATPEPMAPVKSVASASSITTSQEQIVEKAKQEAYVVQRISELQKEGLWSEKRLPKVQEMSRGKAHWDFLLEEMVWLAADFAQERKWKKAAAKKCARMVQKYFQDKALAAQRAEKAHEQHLKRIASYCAKEIKVFWGNVEKLVEYKQNTILEEKRKKALDQQLSFIVDQTEKYSQLLAEGMNKSIADVPSSNMSSRSASRPQSDEEFDPEQQSDEDDEETIAQEEAALAQTDQSAEVEALQRESQLELDDLLEDDFLKDYLLNRDSIRLSGSEDSDDDSEDKKSKKSEPEPVSGKKVPKEKTMIEKESKSDSNDSDDDSDSEDESDADETQASQSENQSLKLLVDDSHKDEGEKTKTDEKDDLINDAAAIAESIQPKGNTLSSTTVSTTVPFLLKLPLREYQHIGLDWLVTMYERKLNGILADEMGLGKTIQTIALLAHLACEKENWGPHLIVVPTSVMLNWEMECKKWCPAFKILTYYGSQKERKQKRTGWTKPNTFHICITSYKLVIQDHQSFRRKKWKYLILDEAQNIKNFKSQRWQLLLNFQTERRLLLTGTPLQNNLMELWSLMHFLMPNVFQSHREFKEWFSNPVTGMIEGNSEYNDSIIKRLHKVLRPFLLRRLKSEVEKQMPKKYEHVVMCRLSKRQRFLYDDYMSRAKTRETLVSGNLLSVISVLMQLRKVCNHPNLFEIRPTTSPFQCDSIKLHVPSIVYAALQFDVFKHVNLYSMNFLLIMLEMHLGAYQCYRLRQSAKKVITLNQPSNDIKQPPCPPCKLSMKVKVRDIKQEEKKGPVCNAVTQSNVKMKVAGVQVLSQRVVKTVPLINISQASGQMQLGTPISVASVLKSADKVPTSFAQLVQTSTGKHLLLTSNPNIAGNMPVTQTTAGGQKLTFLSTKQPSLVNANVVQPITKAYVKFQLTSVATGTTTTSSNSTAAARGGIGGDGLRHVNSNFLGQLYSKQNSLDVRWRRDDHRRSSGQAHDDHKNECKKRLQLMTRINEQRCSALPLYGRDFQDVIKIFKPNQIDPWNGGYINCLNALFEKNVNQTTAFLKDALYSPERRIEELKETCDRFIFYVPAVKADEPEIRVWHPNPSEYWARKEEQRLIQHLFSKPATPLHHIASAMVTQFPDPRLIQYDCGKLQTLDKLLRQLKTDTHRVLIFTQMTKMLDVLEAFLNFHGHIYLRLDGSTKVDQRQVLMERFNGDKRIFAFILSTRSGGVGVNLTGADTVIFYDSDWNPTMDAQAQDRCHRIGQTRDVHIYRLVSERTIEENILKKANQKRLLGDLAIEGGNFTTAYFKSSTTIQDLFNIDQTLETAAQRMSDMVEMRREKEIATTSSETSLLQLEDKSAAGALENALAACEDDQDVQAAKIAKAEAVADLAEFDENIPLDQETEKEKEPEVSRAEMEINNIIKKLSPIEKYAMKFIEQTESAWSPEQLAAATRQIEDQKREWELNQMAAMREEEERRQREVEEENDMITYTREDATNQVWVSDNTMEQMPMWCPPTPPQQDSDVYMDQSMAFLYDDHVMSESQLPPAYVKKDPKRRFEAAFSNLDYRRPLKIPRKEEAIANAPRSLFHSPTLMKMRRDLKLQKYRGLMRPTISVPGKPVSGKPSSEQSLFHNWTVHEDLALLKALKTFQGLPVNLIVMSPAQTPNWDFVAEYVNTVSITYRSFKQCRQRYESHLMHREEGKYSSLESVMRKKKKAVQLQKLPLPNKSRPSPRTSQLYTQDNNTTFSQIISDRFDTLKSITNKRLPTTRTVVNNPLMNKTKNTPVLSDCGIDIEKPVTPVEVAARRAERIAKEKKTVTPEQLAKLQLLQKGMVAANSQQQQQQQQAQAQTSLAASTSGPAVAQSSSGVTTMMAVPTTQVMVSQGSIVVTTTAPVVTAAPGTPPSGLRPQRIIASPLQTSTVVSVSGLSPAQLHAAQRLIVSAGGSTKTVGAVATAQGKQFSQAQLHMIRQATIKNQLRLHANNLVQGTKTSTVTIGGQQAVVQFTQAQPRAQFVRQGTVTVGGKTGVTRTVTDSEVAQLLKKQHQLQQQKMASGNVAQVSNAGNSGNTIHGLTTQVFAQAIQPGTSGAQVATLVKAVPSASGVSQTVTIPVSGVTLATTGAKAIAPSLKPTTAQQLRHLQIQHQILAQKKLAAAAAAAGGQKLSIATSGAKGGGVQTAQLIVGGKQAMTVQQFQQVIRTPLNVGQGPVVLAKGGQRVIPVNTGQGTKQTIQVVAASSQALGSALRPQGTTTIAGIKLQGATNTSQHALLSQVSAALSQNVNVRQNSPVRIQTASGQPIMAVTVQSPLQNMQSQSPNPEQVSRFMKK